MNRLWAPWRAEYLRTSGNDECIFCEMCSNPSIDRDNYVLYRSPGMFIVLNRYPYINGHLMVVPTRHVPDLGALDAPEREEMMDLLVLAEKALVRGMNCMGINGGWNLGNCAGAGIEGHLHMHMLPRWSGDVNFMTVVGSTRVLSESLEDCYERMLPLFGESMTNPHGNR